MKKSCFHCQGYFECPANHGLFARAQNLVKVQALGKVMGEIVLQGQKVLKVDASLGTVHSRYLCHAARTARLVLDLGRRNVIW